LRAKELFQNLNFWYINRATGWWFS
jgi:hypothetical protein